MTLPEIIGYAEEGASLGALWCSITGGEPLARDDFEDVYLALKRLGLFVSVFTYASLLRDHHVQLFKRYPPREVEVTVYGITRKTFGRITGRPTAFRHLERGLGLLAHHGIPVRLKAMALKSNLAELPQIAEFCRSRTKDYFRFDPILHLRYDGHKERNAMIRQERLTPRQVVALERSDRKRTDALVHHCWDLIMESPVPGSCDHLFRCGAGLTSFVIGHDGRFRLCSSLNAPGCVYDLRSGSLTHAWREFVPRVRSLHSANSRVLEKCLRCPIINLCLWCPAHAHLENGSLDTWTGAFCRIAHARAAMIETEVRDRVLRISPRDETRFSEGSLFRHKRTLRSG